jgi:hydroxymethylbilane synthase
MGRKNNFLWMKLLHASQSNLDSLPSSPLLQGMTHEELEEGKVLNLDFAKLSKVANCESDVLPAIAQGAIGIERRETDSRAAEMLSAIHDEATGQQLAAERAFLKSLDGSCETPIAGLALLDGTTLHLRGEVLRPDGSESIKDARSAPIADGAELGRAMAEDMLREAGKGFFDWRL